MIRMMSSMKTFSAMFVATTFTSAALAATTTLTFDEFSDETPITNQYQSVGVTASGATAFFAAQGPWPANTGANIAYSPTGIMTFDLDASLTGDVKTVSAYISTVSPTGIYAYDMNGNLVGQAVTAGAVNNQLLSVTSSGAPIVKVVIHDSGTNFGVDTLKLEAPEDTVICQDVIGSLYGQIKNLVWQEFKNQPEQRRKSLLTKIVALKLLIDGEKKIQNNPTLLKISLAAKALLLKNIRKEINDGIKAGPKKTELLNTLNLLEQMINQKLC